MTPLTTPFPQTPDVIPPHVPFDPFNLEEDPPPHTTNKQTPAANKQTNNDLSDVLATHARGPDADSGDATSALGYGDAAATTFGINDVELIIPPPARGERVARGRGQGLQGEAASTAARAGRGSTDDDNNDDDYEEGEGNDGGNDGGEGNDDDDDDDTPVRAKAALKRSNARPLSAVNEEDELNLSTRTLPMLRGQQH
jgi:hypothetical protein